ncbi:MAG TPA: DUF6335 family protein [Methylomirabilota bacterium]|nr:DUF6335 family protein [Methylomirabilota bacterium]
MARKRSGSGTPRKRKPTSEASRKATRPRRTREEPTSTRRREARRARAGASARKASPSRRPATKERRPAASAPTHPAAPAASADEALLGPPPAEALLEPSDQERRAWAEAAQYHETGPDLSGGDVDADWQRAASSGEEAVGGTVATPDQDQVDELGDALGVPRQPDEEVRSSAEILADRDRRRREE